MTGLLGLVFGDRKSLAIGCVATAAAAVLFSASGQMLAIGSDGPVLLASAEKAIIFALLALLVGLQAALQSYALRLRVRQGGVGAGAGGFVLAFLGASCCTPLIWPALLSVAGVSGVTLLGLNTWLHQWFWVPVILSAAFLILGLLRTMHALRASCNVPSVRS